MREAPRRRAGDRKVTGGVIRAATTSVYALGIGALLLAGCSPEPPTRDAAGVPDIAVPVAAQRARLGTLQAIIRTSGVVSPMAGAEFLATATEPGRIVEITKVEGDTVARGDALVRFDRPSAPAEAARNEAEIARAQALLESARISQGRARDLLGRGIISRREMEDADRRVADAQADVSRAEGARTAADAASARAVILAPFAGVVAQRLRNPGDVVQGIAGDPILRIVDPDRLEVVASIAGSDRTRVLPGAAAIITSLPEPVRLVVAARPTAGASAADAIVRLLFAQRPAVPVDTRVDLEIEGEEHVNAVIVPIEAIVRTGSEATVMVAAGDRAERRVVTTGIASEESVEITSGVADGELVITRGHTGLSDGATISVGAVP